MWIEHRRELKARAGHHPKVAHDAGGALFSRYSEQRPLIGKCIS
jgi:hypothetical protein